MKDSCPFASKLLGKYFDGEATSEEKDRIEAHLHGCPSCRRDLHAMGRLRAAVEAPVEEALQKEEFQWVWQKIERKIRLEERPTWQERVRGWLEAFRLPQKRVLLPAAAAVVLLLIAGQVLFPKTPSYPGRSVVEYVESQTGTVMVYQPEKADFTLIWLFEDPEEETTPT